MKEREWFLDEKEEINKGEIILCPFCGNNRGTKDQVKNHINERHARAMNRLFCIMCLDRPGEY